MEEEEEEDLDSSRPCLGEGMKDNKEVSHILATIWLGCVDLTRDHFPNMVDRVPSPITISSLVKHFPLKMLTPRLWRKLL